MAEITLQRKIYAIVIAIISLSIIQFSTDIVSPILSYNIGGITIGTIAGIIGLYVVYLLLKREI